MCTLFSFFLCFYVKMITTMSSDESCHWYVLRAIFRKEETVRDNLRRQGFRCYVPMRYQLDATCGKKIRRLVPAINELVFVYAKESEISEFKIHSKEIIYWLTFPKAHRREKIIVSDKDMERFIRVTEQSERTVTYFRPEEIQLGKGERIRIHGGAFDGVEGILLKIKGKREKQLVVSIPDLAVAAVSIKPDVVEVLNNQQRPISNDIHGDSKELIRLSTTMLTAPPDMQSACHEWDLLYREINGLYQSLLPRKGYIASTEAQLSLALLLAERALDSVTDSTIQRCRTAAIRLRPSKLRDQLYKELENHNETQ